jgi:hypothetical protein
MLPHFRADAARTARDDRGFSGQIKQFSNMFRHNFCGFRLSQTAEFLAKPTCGERHLKLK